MDNASAENTTNGKRLFFLAFRFKRLMVPWLLAAVTLLPLYKVIYLYSRGLPQEGLSTYFHFNGGILINQGWWMWPWSGSAFTFLCLA